MRLRVRQGNKSLRILQRSLFLLFYNLRELYYSIIGVIVLMRSNGQLFKIDFCDIRSRYGEHSICQQNNVSRSIALKFLIKNCARLHDINKFLSAHPIKRQAEREESTHSSNNTLEIQLKPIKILSGWIEEDKIPL